MSRRELLKERECVVANLAIKIAPMLAKKKPSVLIAFKNGIDEDYDVLINSRDFIRRILNIDFKLIYEGKNRNQVLFYKPKELINYISEKWRNRYLKKFGYNNCQNLEEYLDELSSNFSKTDFPHEIGLFLGYPLKDVVGFIECKEKAKKIDGSMWKIYGCPKTSIALMELYRKISNEMKILLNTNKITNINLTALQAVG